MVGGTRGRGLHRIRNKILAVLVAVAVLPAVAVSLYALRKASDALSEQALTLISEACVTDARHASDVLDGVEQQLTALVKDNLDPQQLLANFMPDAEARSSGERQLVPLDEWKKIQRDLNIVDQKLRRLLEQQRSSLVAFVLSSGFNAESGTPVLWVERADERTPRELVTRDDAGLLRPGAPPGDSLLPRVLDAWSKVRDEHPEREVLRATDDHQSLVDGDALEIFAARVQGTFGTEFGWIFVVHSWRRLLRELHAGSQVESDDAALLSVFKAKDLSGLATTQPGRFVELPDQFGLRDHARGGYANAALFESGEIIAFAPLQPRSDDFSVRYVLAIERSARGLLASVDRFRIVFGAVLAAALLLATLLGLFFARRLTRPLELLRDGATKIGQGDLAQTLDVSTGDEAEELARAFNAMAAELRSLYSGMEQTIHERTTQLQSALDELRHAHDQIVESEKRYSDIVENASDLIQVTDARGRIVSANRRQTELFGTTVDELRGQPFLDWIAPDARAAMQRGLDHVLAGRTLKAYASELLLPASGRRIPVEISATPVVADGKPVGVRAILRDVSERKSIEARLIKAERLSSVGALAAGVAHEINNPLGIITMFAQRALERARKGEIDVDKLEKIVEQGKRVAAITRNLLDFARAAPTRFAPFAIGEVIASTCALVADRAKNDGIDVEQRIAVGLAPITGNSQQISQVLLNLLLNAFQAIGKSGRVSVIAEEVASSRLPTAGRALRVAVDDSGPGIPAEVIPRLFEPFFTTKEPGEGTGLGLSVSYGILKEHHGAIFAQNRSEGGARFEFELPLDGVASSPEIKRPIAASGSGS